MNGQSFPNRIHETLQNQQFSILRFFADHRSRNVDKNENFLGCVRLRCNTDDRNENIRTVETVCCTLDVGSWFPMSALHPFSHACMWYVKTTKKNHFSHVICLYLSLSLNEF